MKRATLVGGRAAGAVLLAAASLAMTVTSGCARPGGSTASDTVSEAPRAPGRSAVGESAEGAAVRQGAATVSVGSTKLGQILVGTKGRSLYLFEADHTPRSVCTGVCAAAWPPLTTQGQPMTGAGAGGVTLGTSHRTDGSTQVTVNGRPVYFYQPDKKAGEVGGQGLNQFNGKWWILDPSGKKITKMNRNADGSASVVGHTRDAHHHGGHGSRHDGRPAGHQNADRGARGAGGAAAAGD